MEEISTTKAATKKVGKSNITRMHAEHKLPDGSFFNFRRLYIQLSFQRVEACEYSVAFSGQVA